MSRYMVSGHCPRQESGFPLAHLTSQIGRVFLRLIEKCEDNFVRKILVRQTVGMIVPKLNLPLDRRPGQESTLPVERTNAG